MINKEKLSNFTIIVSLIIANLSDFRVPQICRTLKSDKFEFSDFACTGIC